MGGIISGSGGLLVVGIFDEFMVGGVDILYGYVVGVVLGLLVVVGRLILVFIVNMVVVRYDIECKKVIVCVE